MVGVWLVGWLVGWLIFYIRVRDDVARLDGLLWIYGDVDVFEGVCVEFGGVYGVM